MNIYIYSDESGVFDKAHNDYFVFAGIILLGAEEKEKWSRLYSNAEKTLRRSKGCSRDYELKATNLLNTEKNSLFRSLNSVYKFGVIIKQNAIHNKIFQSKKDKQRYLDFAYKIAVKRALEKLIKENKIEVDEIKKLYFFVDEHSTATNGKYELKEALEQEFKYGTFNLDYSVHYPPILEKINEVNLTYCNSASILLIRAADIIANKIYFLAQHESTKKIKSIKNANIIYLP